MAYNNEPAQERVNVDSYGIPVNQPCICIPRVFTNISDRRIFAIFRELRLGFVDTIDMVPRKGKDGKEYNMVFVHFRNWFINDEMVATMRERLLDGEQVKIVYEDPWFWKIHAYKPKQPSFRHDDSQTVPFVDLEFRERNTRSRPAPPTHAPPRIEQSTPVNIYSALDTDEDREEREEDHEEDHEEDNSEGYNSRTVG